MVFRYRVALISHVPGPIKTLFPSLAHYAPLSTFEAQANAGLNSHNFDIEANIRDGDSRAGLDERGTQEVLEIMRREGVKYVSHSTFSVHPFIQLPSVLTKPGSYVRTRYSAPTELTPQVWETSPVRLVFIDDCLQECLWMLKLSHDYDLLYYTPVFFSLSDVSTDSLSFCLCHVTVYPCYLDSLVSSWISCLASSAGLWVVVASVLCVLLNLYHLLIPHVNLAGPNLIRCSCTLSPVWVPCSTHPIHVSNLRQ